MAVSILLAALFLGFGGKSPSFTLFIEKDTKNPCSHNKEVL
jgi:hypothetical protein